MSQNIASRSKPRREDDRLLLGNGKFTDDISISGEARVVVLRSPHAHARIMEINTIEASLLPGVIGILTSRDIDESKIGKIPCAVKILNRDGSPSNTPGRPTLAQDRVRFVGEPVAFIVAETEIQALDAAEAIEVTYTELPAVTNPDLAQGYDQPLLHDDAPKNLCIDWEGGDKEKTDQFFEKADKIVKLETRNNRIAPSALEPRAAIGIYESGTGRYTLHTPSQGVHRIQSLLAKEVLNIPEALLRVITPDVGGGFGVKLWLYPEHVLVLLAAKQFKRPVKWVATRTESFLSDCHGRDAITSGEMALDKNGIILALRINNIANLGAFPSYYAPFIPTAGGTRVLSGPYKISSIHMQVKGVYTNCAPVDAYRGAGRPENVFLVQRLLYIAAQELGIETSEMHRRNLISASEIPYTNFLGQTYDSGDFHATLDTALELSEWSEFQLRKKQASNNNRMRGIGLSCYVDPCGGNRDQYASLRFSDTGSIQIAIGTQSSGQGHETAYAQILSDKLGISLSDVYLLQGDSDIVPSGQGSSGSRSISIGGNAVALAANRSKERAKKIAANMLEAAPDDIYLKHGVFEVAGTDRRVNFKEVQKAAFNAAIVPNGEDLGLDSQAHHMAHDVTYPNGCHICEIEIDPDTGNINIVGYWAVDDFGIIINPMLVDGQVHGATAQGIGQALMENSIFDSESGQLLTASFMDYAIPRADDLPNLTLERKEVPCTTNKLGVKGCGEPGCSVSPAAVVNAINNAVSEFGIYDIEMPASPHKLWQLIKNGKYNEVV